MPKLELELEILNGEDVTDDVVAQCATLFSKHYAIWGRESQSMADGTIRTGKS